VVIRDTDCITYVKGYIFENDIAIFLTDDGIDIGIRRIAELIDLYILDDDGIDAWIDIFHSVFDRVDQCSSFKFFFLRHVKP